MVLFSHSFDFQVEHNATGFSFPAPVAIVFLLRTGVISLAFQDWTTSTPSLVIGRKLVEHVDHLTYLGSCISPNGLIADEISARLV